MASIIAKEASVESQIIALTGYHEGREKPA